MNIDQHISKPATWAPDAQARTAMHCCSVLVWALLVLCGATPCLDGRPAEPPASTSSTAWTRKLTGKIAYTGLTGDVWQIWVITLPHGNPRQLTKGLEDKRSPAWDKDGRRIVYRTNDGHLYWIDLESGMTTPTQPTLGHLVNPRPSPVQDEILFARFERAPPDDTNIFRFAFETGSLTRLTDSTDLEFDPAWSPDGKKVAYVGGRGSKGIHLKLMDADGKNKKVLHESMLRDGSPCWSPDGKFILFVSNPTGPYNIWRIAVEGGTPEPLEESPAQNTHPCFAPDGSAIAFTSSRDGDPRIYLMQPDGKSPAPLTPLELKACEPSWWQGDNKGEPPDDERKKLDRD